jgi:glycolate oxidase FAD binding subunit
MTATLSEAHPAVDEIARRVRDAASPRRPLRVVGAGTWLDGGPPVEASERLPAAPAEIIEYVPGDLTMTAGAGTSLATVEQATAEHGQWLTLDPPGEPAATIGATVATGSWGPLATAYGTPRDHVLGLEAVTGTGAIVRGGGRVVKNVAGFDLTRLFTGSRGTLGVITEVTLRLRAKPRVDSTMIIAIDGGASGLRAIGDAVRAWPSTPMAAEVLDGGTAAAIGLPRSTLLALRFGGNQRAVDSQRRRAASLGRVVDSDVDLWSRLRDIESGFAGVVRFADTPSAFIERWTDAMHIAGISGAITGSPTRGWVRCLMTEVDLQKIIAFRSRARTASVVIDRLPSASAWHSITAEPNPASLDARVKAVFDPASILNPGALRCLK